MNIGTFFALLGCVLVGYLCGNINFARIFSKKIEKEDITEVGSKNPGAMNVLRTHGFGQAILTLAFEAIKVGVPSLAAFFIFKTYLGYENVAYFLTAFAGVIGHCFPVLYKFKGGKGVACTFGMFVFHPNFWWVSLIAFVVCFLIFFFIKYGFVVSLLFIISLSIYATIFFVGAYSSSVGILATLLAIVWLNVLLILVMHRKNFDRLFHGKENKIDLAEKLFKKKKTPAPAENSDAEENKEESKEAENDKE